MLTLWGPSAPLWIGARKQLLPLPSGLPGEREVGRRQKKTQGQGLRHRHNPNQPNPGHNLTQARAKSEFGRLFKIKKKETEPNHGLDCHVSNNGQPCQPMACQEAGPRHGEPTTNRWSANSKTREPWHTMSGPRHCVPWIWLP